mgnify:CR=1 FL=1
MLREIGRVILRFLLRSLSSRIVLTVVVLGSLSIRRTIVLLRLLERSWSTYGVRRSRRILILSEAVSVIVLSIVVLILPISRLISFCKTSSRNGTMSRWHVATSSKVVNKSSRTVWSVGLCFDLTVLGIVILFLTVVVTLLLAVVVILTSA